MNDVNNSSPLANSRKGLGISFRQPDDAAVHVGPCYFTVEVTFQPLELTCKGDLTFLGYQIQEIVPQIARTDID